MVKRIAVLGSTGSIGTNTLNVIEHLGPSYQATALSAHSQSDKLLEQVLQYKPSAVAVTDDGECNRIRSAIESTGARCYQGAAGLVEMVTRDDIDIVMASIVGAAGLPAVFAAVQAGKTLALANKEALVVAGSLLIPEARRRGVSILPVDSEHSAIFQAMVSGRLSEVRRVILTASGGPFRTASREQTENATLEDALAHPTWRMGKKNTIDSASMFNKGLELIEACWLFDLPPEKVEIVIHPESVVHSMVEFVDGSVIAQLSPPDMRMPIQYALTYPRRAEGNTRKLDITQSFSLNFHPPDGDRFPAIRIAQDVARRGGTLGAVMNAANEIAVEAFAGGKIPFGGIARCVERTIDTHSVQATPSLDDLFEADRWARRTAEEVIRKVSPTFDVLSPVVRATETSVKAPAFYGANFTGKRMPTPLLNVLMIALMVFGFGFVVFWHELGHFLAAKWVGIKVEQFAVGFGQALFAFRKGIGWKVGTTTPEYKRRIEAHLAAKGIDPSSDPEQPYTETQMRTAADELGLGETEYRLNWMPLGGYVKMLGQDDLKPNAEVSDPHAYNRKSISARMLVVSAGVIMNIILAAVGFMIVFLIGFNVPPAIVGSVISGSPAQKAGLLPGDNLISLDGSPLHGDFTKLGLNTALLPEGAAVPVDYMRPGLQGVQHTTIQAARTDADKKGFLSIGVGASPQLTGLNPKLVTDAEFKQSIDPTETLADAGLVRPGDTITSIAGVPVTDVKQAYLLDQALQTSNGAPVPLTIKAADGTVRNAAVTPIFQQPFSATKPLNFVGMETLPVIVGFVKGTAAKGPLKPGDVVVAMTLNDLKRFPTITDLREMANKAYEENKKLTIDVLRPGADASNPTPVKVANVVAAVDTGKGHHGMGISPTSADRVPIVSAVEDDSPSKKAGIPSGARIVQVDGEKVENWFQIRTLLQKASGEHKIVASVPDVQDPQAFTINLAPGDVDSLKNLRITHAMQLQELKEPRKTSSALTAAAWGVTETRDFVLQFYVTLKRMFQGSVSPGNMMGPVGIVGAGAHFATKGADWLIWFLAMISANLAVVNFLPIPIVDGGLFTFLIVEKLQGKPVSPKTQLVAQIMGFALIISVFMLVTYNDIARFFGR